MQQLRFILVTSLIITCMADDMKNRQSTNTKMDQKAKDMKPEAEGPKKTKDPSMPSNDASKSTMDHVMMNPKMMDTKTAKDAPEETKSMPESTHNDPNGSNGHPKDARTPKSKEDMKVEASVGLGFYAGVLPVSNGGYGGYGYGYPYNPLYRSYYARPYYAYPYSYRPVVPVIVKPRPVPLLLG